MDSPTLPPLHGVAQVAALLSLPEVGALVAGLEEARWTGRPGYPTRSLVAVVLAKSVYALPTWSRTLRLVGEHAALREVVGCVPSDDAMTRFKKKLIAHRDLLDKVLDAVVVAVKGAVPEYGVDVAQDGSDMPAYANGQKYLSKGGPERKRFSDPDASWGHRSSIGTRKGGGYYGYKLHLMVCARTELPVAWTVRTARDAEKNEVPALLDFAALRGITPKTATFDKGYDAQGIYDELIDRGIRPVIALMETLRVQEGAHLPPECGHGEWTFAGADDKRQATTWRCPTGECKPGSIRRPYSRLHPPIPHESARWRKLYRGRTSVERAFGRLKDGGLTPLRVRRIERVRLHADLTILTTLATALARARAVPLAA